MGGIVQTAVRKDELLEQLGQVLDPELDESILERGFVDSLQVKKGSVTVKLQLATRIYPLDQVNEAMHDLIDGQIPGRGVLVP